MVPEAFSLSKTTADCRFCRSATLDARRELGFRSVFMCVPECGYKRCANAAPFFSHPSPPSFRKMGPAVTPRLPDLRLLPSPLPTTVRLQPNGRPAKMEQHTPKLPIAPRTCTPITTTRTPTPVTAAVATAPKPRRVRGGYNVERQTCLFSLPHIRGQHLKDRFEYLSMLDKPPSNHLRWHASLSQWQAVRRRCEPVSSSNRGSMFDLAQDANALE